jgi:CO/xanthine dehydrogenase Mo-binding subunit
MRMGTQDLGTGTRTLVAVVTAESLGLQPSQIKPEIGDTMYGVSPGSGGSTITYSAGRAIRLAAEDAARQLLAAAAIQLEISVDDLELAEGAVRPRGVPDKAIPIAKLVRDHQRAGRAPIDGQGRSEQQPIAPSVSGHAVRVSVDRGTGRVQVLDDHVVQDVGRALNPALVEGQIRGGAAQAIGWALLEQLVHDDAGQLLTGTFLDYPLPRAEDVGHLSTTSVEVPAPNGPLGARGIGEAPVIPGPAAVANAIAAAIGVRLRQLPMTPARVWRAVAPRDAS